MGRVTVLNPLALFVRRGRTKHEQKGGHFCAPRRGGGSGATKARPPSRQIGTTPRTGGDGSEDKNVAPRLSRRGPKSAHVWASKKRRTNGKLPPPQGWDGVSQGCPPRIWRGPANFRNRSEKLGDCPPTAEEEILKITKTMPHARHSLGEEEVTNENQGRGRGAASAVTLPMILP